MVTSVAPPAWRWDGRIITRAWPADLDLRELQLLRVGGRERRLACPDGLAADGVSPLYRLSTLEARAAARLLDRECLDAREVHNVPCNAGRTVLLNFLANTGGLSGISYFAVGTGAGTPASGDTQLFSEYFRKAITTSSVNVNVLTLACVFASSEANTTYTEAGIFGNGATGTANSGQLFAHASYPYTKTSSLSLTNDYLITLS